MSVAEKIEKENSDCLRLKAKDNDGGETTYRRMGPQLLVRLRTRRLISSTPIRCF